MKKLLVLMLTAASFCYSGANGQSVSWIKTADGQVNCKKINIRGETLKVVLDNGEKQIFPVSSVSSCCINDKLYSKMPFYAKEGKSETFMELIKTRDDMSLYRFIDKGTSRYLVYKGNVLYIELLDNNRAEFEKYFSLALK